MIRFIRLYNERWNCTNRMLLLLKIFFTAIVFFICCWAVNKDMFVTYDATKSGLFSIMLSLIWNGLFNSLGLYNTEYLYTNDHLDKSLPLYAYMGGTLWIHIKLCFVQALECITIYFLFFEFNQKSVVFHIIFLDYFCTFYLIIISSDMLGLAVGICVNSINSVLTVIPIVLVAQLILSGCLFEFDGGVIEYISNFTIARYGFSALGSIANLNSDDLPLKISTYYPQVVKQASDLFNCSRTYVCDCWRNLFLLMISSFLIAGLFLYVKINWKN